MKFYELQQQMKNYLIFSLQDLEKLYPHFRKALLNEWQKKKYIQKILKKYYILLPQEINEKVLFHIANIIYSPSYISYEMALSYYQFIPESTYQITSVTSLKTQNFNTPLGIFSYHRQKPILMFGYTLQPIQNHVFKIAEPEKAILDYLYIHSNLKSEDDYFELRLNRDMFFEKINIEKLNQYAMMFKNKSLLQRLNTLLEVLSNAEY